MLTNFVPKGKVDLVAENSERFPVVEEAIEKAGVADVAKKEAKEFKIEDIPSSFDRDIEPAKGPAPDIKIPKVWTQTYKNG